jgi:hypothetical protein
MIKRTIILFVSVSLASCDPVYSLTLNNESSDTVIVRTSPSLESKYTLTPSFQDTIRLQLSPEQVGDVHIYKLRPHTKFKLLSGIGAYPSIEYDGFKMIQLIKERDTIRIVRNTDFAGVIRRQGKSRTYYIDFK